MYEPGQFLDDITIISIQKPYGTRHYVWASYVEDSSAIDLETMPFIYQEEPVHHCPRCGVHVTILIVLQCLDGVRNLCEYCSDCDLLYRSRVIGVIADGEFTSWESVQ